MAHCKIKKKKFDEPYICHQSIFVQLQRYLPSDLCTEKALKAVSWLSVGDFISVFFLSFVYFLLKNTGYFHHENNEI